ncbi:MAG: YebC/PmpR family DNA-binding transcriptional regulator [Planctomycetes bacterium]|jgi:YebC/PmpR family DNA-binding regulatory protein|nr:YebC/PmpR family DNA-binding transcriptional regulator [Planctomycetota bacterium]MCL4729764.1 YebC/PmpR family DNA-binding transcriptional regulator [Planctomycetota bacterium]
MAGHSKWANIKHRKAASDKKRGKAWSKAAHAIIVAARLGGGDIRANSRLAMAVHDAKKVNMPADTIDRAIKRGTGELQGPETVELTYEGYGPGGVAMVIECLTDNRNRTAPDIKHIFEKFGGSFGAQGSVMHSFSRKGIIVVRKDKAPEEALFDMVVGAGAEDLTADDEFYTITTGPAEFEPVKKALEKAAIITESAQLEYVPHLRNAIDLETARELQKLLDALEDNNDVQNIFTNHEPPEAFLNELNQS